MALMWLVVTADTLNKMSQLLHICSNTLLYVIGLAEHIYLNVEKDSFSLICFHLIV